MSRRRLSTFVTAIISAMMIGMRDSTGLAAPPPVLHDEVTEWLATGPDDDREEQVFLAAAADVVGVDSTHGTEAAPRWRGVSARWIGRVLGLDV